MDNPKTYIVINGLLYEARSIDTIAADRFAEKNGELYIERITKKYDLQILLCDPKTDKIKRTLPIKPYM